MRRFLQPAINVFAARSFASSMTWLGHIKASAQAGKGAVTKG